MEQRQYGQSIISKCSDILVPNSILMDHYDNTELQGYLTSMNCCDK
jgi:hypothetical protein